MDAWPMSPLVPPHSYHFKVVSLLVDQLDQIHSLILLLDTTHSSGLHPQPWLGDPSSVWPLGAARAACKGIATRICFQNEKHNLASTSNQLLHPGLYDFVVISLLVSHHHERPHHLKLILGINAWSRWIPSCKATSSANADFA